jgi:DNA-directed RNA polymerase sigma subunit (sigma70/sigma32)
MTDFNVKMTVRSERVLRAIEDKFGTQSEMARQTGINQGAVNAFVTMRQTPIGLNGWTEAADKFAAALGEYPSDLWPEHMREVKLKRATAELSLDMDQVMAIASDGNPDLKFILGKSFKGMNPRSMKAIGMTMEGATLEDIGAELGVGKERARQIMFKGYRTMRENLHRFKIDSVTDALT